MSLGKECLCHSANSRTARCCLCCSCFVFSTFLHFSEVHVVTCYIQNTLFLFCTFEFLVSYLDAKCDGYCKYRLGLITLSPGSCNFRCSTGWDYHYTCKWNSQPKLIPLLWLGNVLGIIRIKRHYEIFFFFSVKDEELYKNSLKVVKEGGKWENHLSKTGWNLFEGEGPLRIVWTWK